MVEFVLFDTCVMLEMRDIFEQYEDIDFRSIINKFHWGLTEELRNEYSNYKLDTFLSFKEAYLIPISSEKKATFVSKYLLDTIDGADQDLIFLADYDKATVISNDSDVMFPCENLHLDALFFWEFCIQLVKDHTISKNVYNRCWKYWEQRKRYTKARLKKMKEAINLLEFI